MMFEFPNGDISGRVSVGWMVGAILLAGLGGLAMAAASTISCLVTGTARCEMGMLARAVPSYRLAKSETETLPEALDLLVRDGYLEREELDDPWDRGYVYRKNGPGSFEIVSSGPDRRLGTGDDIAVHRSWGAPDTAELEMK